MEDELHLDREVASGSLTGIRFSILTEADAGKMSTKIIRLVNEVTDPALGLPNDSSECLTCGAKDVKICEGHFGLIPLSCSIVDPYYMTEVAQILNKICPGCKFVRHDKVKDKKKASLHIPHQKCKYCDGTTKGYPRMIFKVSSKNIFGRTAIIAEVKERKLQCLGGDLAPDYWNIIPPDGQQIEKDGILPSNKKLLSPAQVYYMLKDVDPRFLEDFVKTKSSIFLNFFLLTPNCQRVREFGQHLLFDEKTRACRRLIDFRGTANELSTRVLECRKASKINSEKSSNIETTTKVSGSKYIKELLLGKRTDRSFRMVVVGDPNIKLEEIGVPCHIAERLLISERLNTWNWNNLNAGAFFKMLGGFKKLVKGGVYVRRRGDLVCISFMDKLQLGDTVYRTLRDGDIVLINRPPSIHQHSLIALSVKILPINSVLSINPLICSPLRGDFDGDCLHGYVPQSLDSRIELLELVGLNRQLIDLQSGKNLLSLSHDSLTAAHLVVEDGVFLNQVQMQQLQMLCPYQLQVPAIVKASPVNCYSGTNLSEACLWTGKQLLSLLFPPDFNYTYPSNGSCIKNGDIILCPNGFSWQRDVDNNLVRSLIKHCQVEALDFLQAAQELLCEWLSMRGLSVSLSDLYLSSDSNSRKVLMDEVFYGLREAEHLSHVGLLMMDYNHEFLCGNTEESCRTVDFGIEHRSYEQQNSAVLSQVFVSAFKQVFQDIQNLAYQYCGNDNSLMAMLKAGSKGNAIKLVQHSMCLGLQHSSVPLSFRMPHQLSCMAWNAHKATASLYKACYDPKIAASYVPCSVVKSSFLTGLNPLECFVHSLATRDNSFSGRADVSGTLTRKLMFFMRDICIRYDGTVRNAYGNQIVQFSYIDRKTSLTDQRNGFIEKSANCHGQMGGHPVGSLAACAISEAAYSALDQPVTAIGSSPLLNLKKVLDCGVKRNSGDKTATLFLSEKLGSWTCGFEYGALEAKSHLERVRFSDIVSTVMIYYTSEFGSSKQTSPWICHFHILKNCARDKRLRLGFIVDALQQHSQRSKKILPNLHITSKSCFAAETTEENDVTLCITVSIAESSMDSSAQLTTLREMVIPFLLDSHVKGFLEVKKVDILWLDWQKERKSYSRPSGEIYLRVLMSEDCDRTKFWGILMNRCLHIMDMIDWKRSHPDDIPDLTSSYGVDLAWKYFLSGLRSAICETGKTVLLEHLLLAADCLSTTGEFVSLNSKGLAQQRKLASITTPFLQACFSNPGDCFTKAAKLGLVDHLQGSVDALSWGRMPPIGTGGHFDIIYAGKGYEVAKSEDIYNLLGSHISGKVSLLDKEHHVSENTIAQQLCTYNNYEDKGKKSIISKAMLENFSPDDIEEMARKLKDILCKYSVNGQLSEVDKSLVMMALFFHPRRSEKIGTGAQEIKVGHHSKHDKSLCFVLERTDGTVEDFSYHKCLHHALELIAPRRAKTYKLKWLNGKA